MAQIRFPQLPPHVPARGSKLSRTFFRQLFLAQGWRMEGEFPDLAKAVAIISPHTSNIDAWLGFNALLGLGIQITISVKTACFALHSSRFWNGLGSFRWYGIIHKDIPDRL